MNNDFYLIYRNLAFTSIVFAILTGGILYYKTNDFGVVIVSLVFIGMCGLAAFVFQMLHDLENDNFKDDEDEFEDDDENEFDDDDYNL